MYSVEMERAHYSVDTTPLQKLRVGLVAMLLIVVLGTAGFHWLENIPTIDALYMTIITISTVGFGEVTPLHVAGKLLTIGLILISFFVAASIITFMGQMTLEGHFAELVKRRQMERKIHKLNAHYIIAGYGRVGRHVAIQFAQKKVPYVVIENDPASADRITAEGHPFIIGDATDEEVLQQAGIERAHTLISTLPQEAHNVYLTLTARHMNNKMRIIARADIEEGEKKLRRAGADHVVIPHVLGGIRMAKAALQPNVVDFMKMTAAGEAGLIVEELVVPEKSRLDGRTLVDSGLKERYGVTIVGIRQVDKQMQINPGPRTLLQAGDTLVLLGHTESLEELSTDLKS